MASGSSVTWITPMARAQAVIQAFFRPGMWLPLIRRLHSHKEKWIMPSGSNGANMEDILRGLMTVMLDDKSRSHWVIKKADPTFVQVHIFTRFEWLDVIEFKINGSSVEVCSFSTGLFPLCIPFAFVINLMCFWFPFYDFGLNKRRIGWTVAAMDIGLQRMRC